MPLIAVLLNGIPAIIAAIVSFITRKVGTAAGSITLFILMTGAFVACINSIMQSVLAVISLPLWVSNGVGMFMPANWAACISAVVSSKICRVAYDMALLKIKLVNNAS